LWSLITAAQYCWQPCGSSAWLFVFRQKIITINTSSSKPRIWCNIHIYLPRRNKYIQKLSCKHSCLVLSGPYLSTVNGNSLTEIVATIHEVTWQHGSNMEKQDELPEKSKACILLGNGEQNFVCRCKRKIPAKKVFCVRNEAASFLFRMTGLSCKEQISCS
jgi:hypothetical protein